MTPLCSPYSYASDCKGIALVCDRPDECDLIKQYAGAGGSSPPPTRFLKQLCVFYTQISQKNPPKVCTRSFNFNSENAKAPSCGTTPPPPPPFPRSVASLPRLLPPSNIVDNLPPSPGKKNPVHAFVHVRRSLQGILSGSNHQVVVEATLPLHHPVGSLR